MRWAGRPRQWSWRRCEANRSRNVSSCPPRWSSATRAVELHPATGRGKSSLLRAEPDARVDHVKPEIEELMRRMTLLEKIGQMTQVDVNSLQEGAVRECGIGSVLSGGGGNPTPNDPAAGAEMVRRGHAEALESRLGIPLLYGVGATHGHSNLRGATIFPHNVGLGATRGAGLVERIGRVTAREMLATNVHWTFAPAVSVPQDIRWGPTYEAFSQAPACVSPLVAAYVRALNQT